MGVTGRQQGASRTSPPADGLKQKARDALANGKFKEAIDLFKQILRQDRHPQWRQLLSEAYVGRARAMVAKGMFKDAAAVIENTSAPDGTVADPLLYLHCLIQSGQQPKAAGHALAYIGTAAPLPPDVQGPLEGVAAALWLAHRPQLAMRQAPPERVRWLETATTASQALQAWADGLPTDELALLTGRISLRSPFRPVRVLLMALAAAPGEADRHRRMLDEAIPPGSPFYGFRVAVEASLPGSQPLAPERWTGLTPAQQAFVSEARGIAPDGAKFLSDIASAEPGGPAAVFSLLARQSGLPPDDIRTACLSLLPSAPDRLRQFERIFGALSAWERARILAIAAEERRDMEKAGRSWVHAVAALEADAARDGLAEGVVLRHVASIATHPETSIRNGRSVAIRYLTRAYAADPDHLPGLLQLIGHCREDGDAGHWHSLAKEAAYRFPREPAALTQAIDAAVERKEYREAAALGRAVLDLDPINHGVRLRMIDMHIAHARQEMRAGRHELAAEELSVAAGWDSGNARSAQLRIAAGIVEMHIGKTRTPLKEGIALIADEGAGWIRAATEAYLMESQESVLNILLHALRHALKGQPTKAGVLAALGPHGHPDADDYRQAIGKLLPLIQPWLTRAASLDWLPAEFREVAYALTGIRGYGVLAEHAMAAKRRDPADPCARFHLVVAEVHGDAGRLSERQRDELVRAADEADARDDSRTAAMIDNFLDDDMDEPDEWDAADEDDYREEVEHLLATLPPGILATARTLVNTAGPERAAFLLMEKTGEQMGEMPDSVRMELCEAIVERVLDEQASRYSQR